MFNDNYCKQMFIIGTQMDNTICFSSLMLMHAFEVSFTVVISIYKNRESKSIYYLIQQDMRINEQMGNTMCNRSFFCLNAIYCDTWKYLVLFKSVCYVYKKETTDINLIISLTRVAKNEQLQLLPRSQLPLGYVYSNSEKTISR